MYQVMVNTFTNIKQRVVQVAKKQPMTQEDFFKSIGMTSASFRGKALHTQLRSEAIVNIITKYPEVDVYWLLLGEGRAPGELKIYESGNSYKKTKVSQAEKDKIIALQKQQIEELKADKEDLRELLKLTRKK